jgi:hypothetical protein
MIFSENRSRFSGSRRLFKSFRRRANVTIRFEKPAGATGAYEFTASGQLWKVTIPKGEWGDVVLSTDPGDQSSNLVVLSNDPSVSPEALQGER